MHEIILDGVGIDDGGGVHEETHPHVPDPAHVDRHHPDHGDHQPQAGGQEEQGQRDQGKEHQARTGNDLEAEQRDDVQREGDHEIRQHLADLLGIKRGALNARIGRAGGAAPGLVIEGWCCVGLAVPKRGGPAQALWQQA